MRIEELKGHTDALIAAASEIYVGNEPLIRKTLCAMLSNGHVLFEDRPGLGKTLLAKVFARIVGCGWGRIQFTPDLMPADIMGTKVWRPRSEEFRLERGPVFTNILLADEINRAPPKTQSALLEAMEERQVTIEGETHQLEAPFFVIATQNPIEQEGTFPLPEAQMDRFMVRLRTGYVDDIEDETEILRRRLAWGKDSPVDDLMPIIDRDTMLSMQSLVEGSVYVDELILRYICAIVRGTREHRAVRIGSSPRGSLALLKLSKAHAAIMGRDFVTPDDVKAFAVDALSHRLMLRMEYELDEGLSSERVILEVLDSVDVPATYSKG